MAAPKIPEVLKQDVPATRQGKLLAATPVVMTVIATLLAGLSSSEMTRAQYSRSMAAQLQSKAGDQWAYFQAKKMRGALQAQALDLLAAQGEIRPIIPSELGADTPGLAEPERAAIAALAAGEPPAVVAPAEPPADIVAALAALEDGRPPAENAPLVLALDEAVLDAAVRAAQDRVAGLDAALGPITNAVRALEAQFARMGAGAERRRDLAAARIRYQEKRYDAEARLNARVARLIEVQVRRANLVAERHHARSQRFFYGMLAAQLAVIVSTLALAARQRNLLWGLAAAAGAAAVAFAAYVYLYV